MWTSCSFIAPYFRSRLQNGISFIAFADRSSIRFIFDYTFDLINFVLFQIKFPFRKRNWFIYFLIKSLVLIHIA